MNAKLLIVGVTCGLLAACNEPAATTNKTAAVTPATTDVMEAKIAKLPPALQRTTFFRAIQDADYECQNIVNVVPRGKPDGKPLWAVECDGGRQYVIELQPGDIFHVSGVPKGMR